MSLTPFLWFGVLFSLATVGCGSSGNDLSSNNSSSANVTFEMVQTQVFAVSCTFSSCHGANSPQQGLNLTLDQAYTNLVNVASTELAALGVAEDRVTPSEPDRSYILEKLRSDSPRSGVRMPIDQPLDAARIDMVARWIAAGAAEN